MNIRVVINQLKTDWKPLILSYPHLQDIENFLSHELEVYGTDIPTFPSPENIFRCFSFFNIAKTKVVLLGQDPYHGDNQAIGLCFGIGNTEKSPPSLRNIQGELVTDIGVDLKSKTLEYWGNQGVLLLNTALTVRRKSPASHMSVWLPFTKYIISSLNVQTKSIVFVAWGAFAYDKLKDIDQTKHHLLVSSHPSPFSARRTFKQFPAFLNSRPFSQINSKLDIAIHW